MRWYRYSQNNSGGYYLGPAVEVVVRAESVEEANSLALEAGVDPDAPYCDCCGTRWTLFDPEWFDPIEGYHVVDDLADFDPDDDTLIVEAS